MKKKEEDVDVRYSTCLSLIVEVHLPSSLSNGEKGFITYSTEVKALANPGHFFKESNQQKIMS